MPVIFNETKLKLLLHMLNNGQKKMLIVFDIILLI